MSWGLKVNAAPDKIKEDVRFRIMGKFKYWLKEHLLNGFIPE